MTSNAGRPRPGGRDGGGSPARTPAAPAAARRQPPRHVVQSYACPQCGAAPGQPCQGRRGPRVSNHYQRVEAAWAQLPTRADRLRDKQRRLRAERATRTSTTHFRPTPAQSKTYGAQAPSRAARPDPEGVDGAEHRTECGELGGDGAR